ASFGDKLKSVTYWDSLQMRWVADDKACRCRQLVTSRVGLSPILGNPGSQITSSVKNIGGRSSVERRMRSEGGLKTYRKDLARAFTNCVICAYDTTKEIMALRIDIQPETLAKAVALEEARAREVVAVKHYARFVKRLTLNLGTKRMPLTYTKLLFWLAETTLIIQNKWLAQLHVEGDRRLHQLMSAMREKNVKEVFGRFDEEKEKISTSSEGIKSPDAFKVVKRSTALHSEKDYATKNNK
nr:hypothetical protein [Tanacetum cinerariifolium]